MIKINNINTVKINQTLLLLDNDTVRGMDRFHESPVNKLIEKAGWMLEDQDSGTAMLWKS